MPEWYLAMGALLALALVGTLWTPLLVATLPLLVLAACASLVRAWGSAVDVTYDRMRPTSERWALRALTATLHLLQPLARLRGWLSQEPASDRPSPREWTPLLRALYLTAWSERWKAPTDWVRGVQTALQAQGTGVVAGGDFDGWDLEIRGGRLGGLRALVVVEEHGAGRQLARLRAWPRCAGMTAGVAAGLAVLGGLAYLDGAAVAAGILEATALLIAGQVAVDVALAGGAVVEAWTTLEASLTGEAHDR